MIGQPPCAMVSVVRSGAPCTAEPASELDEERVLLHRFPKKATGRNYPCGPWRSFGRACDILVRLRDTTMFSDRRARGSKSRNLNHANIVTPSRTRSSPRGDRRPVLKSSKVSKSFLDTGGTATGRWERRDGRVFADRQPAHAITRWRQSLTRSMQCPPACGNASARPVRNGFRLP